MFTSEDVHTSKAFSPCIGTIGTWVTCTVFLRCITTTRLFAQQPMHIKVPCVRTSGISVGTLLYIIASEQEVTILIHLLSEFVGSSAEKQDVNKSSRTLYFPRMSQCPTMYIMYLLVV